MTSLGKGGLKLKWNCWLFVGGCCSTLAVLNGGKITYILSLIFLLLRTWDQA
jgi:uncharacterized membrane protein YjjP (DUF1212 family)